MSEKKYSKKSVSFQDGRGGYHRQGSLILCNGEETGIVEISEKESHQKPWVTVYHYKLRRYDSFKAVVEAYEKTVEVLNDKL